MINITCVGDEEIRARLTGLPGSLRSNLRSSLQQEMFNLQGVVQEQKLSGQVLKNRTGMLRNSINAKVGEEGTAIVGSVGTNVVYAAVHEYGFQGAVNVRESVRTITQAFGKALKGGAKTVNVRAHTMNMNMPERSFLRSALAETAAQISANLTQTVKDTVSA